jgi:hypothetical protein
LRSTEAAKLKVFVSYSRRDIAVADQLVAALTVCGIAPTIDREDVHAAEEWRVRLGQLILEADTVVFILTPQSATSEICKWEVDEAVRLNKRIVPVLIRPLGEAKPHDYLRGLNYIFFYEEPTAAGSGFGTGLAKLIDALTIDVDWIREHTRLGELAARWDRGSRSQDALLRGLELAHALDWHKSRPANAPELTALQREFLEASEDAEAARTSAERRRLEEMAAAQDEKAKALQAAEVAQRARALVQRRNSILVFGASILALGLLGGAVWQSLETQKREAKILTSLARSATEAGLYDRAMRIALQGVPKPGATPLGLNWKDAAAEDLAVELAGAAVLSHLKLALHGHTNAVTHARYSKDRKQIVTASVDGTIHIWDVSTGRALFALKGHEGAIAALNTTPAKPCS